MNKWKITHFTRYSTFAEVEMNESVADLTLSRFLQITLASSEVFGPFFSSQNCLQWVSQQLQRLAPTLLESCYRNLELLRPHLGSTPLICERLMLPPTLLLSAHLFVAFLVSFSVFLHLTTGCLTERPEAPSC